VLSQLAGDAWRWVNPALQALQDPRELDEPTKMAGEKAVKSDSIYCTDQAATLVARRLEEVAAKVDPSAVIIRGP